ncbi:MAG TPA: hypothetical protein DCZ56_05845 [Sutterella sp.]|nr:hypothetical protein [Sutterella sp.]
MNLTSLRPLPAASAALLAAVLTGCSSLTGLIDAHDEFGCPMSAGVNCTTLSATHRIVERELAEGESPKITIKGTPADAPNASSGKAAAAAAVAEPVPAPAVVPARPSGAMRASESVYVLRILPWVDAEGDLHGDSRVWVRVAEPKWRIESLRRRALSGESR